MSNQILNNDPKTAINAVQEIKKFANKKYGNQFKLNILQLTENDVLYDSFKPGNKEYQPEYEIVRIITTSKGIYRISYTRNSPIDEKTKEKWLGCIQESGLIKLN